MNDWIYNGVVFDEDIKNWYGFVYIITNLTNDKKYFGKKAFWFKKTKKLKGKTKRITIESDWREYYGSCDVLNDEILVIGKENVKREILKLCKNKSECSYYELKYQVENDVVLKDEYYNGWISCKISGKNLK